jgi:hypothetical protein
MDANGRSLNAITAPIGESKAVNGIYLRPSACVHLRPSAVDIS